MAPNNSLVPTAVEKENTVVKDDHSNEANIGLLNRKNKNVLNSNDQIKQDLDQNGNEIEVQYENQLINDEEEYKIEYAWFNIIGFIFLHYALIIGITKIKIDPLHVFTFIFGMFTGFGITAGAHRLWAHGSYKANLGLRLFLTFWQTAAFQNSIYEWTRDHRVHHKFTDTNADPHNASRGFFFSHIGWLMCKKHPDVKKFGKKVDLSDLKRDPIVMFQHKYYLILMPICCFLIPIFIPTLWGVSFINSTYACILRWVIVLHFTWLVNSYAHIWGNKPYNENIKPTDSYTVSMLAFGEGWHNYHHVFPYDYKTSEHGKYWCNYTTGFLEFCAKIGWATDLKTVSAEVIRKRVLRTGDGSHSISQNNSQQSTQKKKNEREEFIWGWQDNLLTENEKKYVTVVNKSLA
ncbi:hypothetical protein PVAND_001406 [Polypedilum vanderplanki]|uniref:Fatty acid desaturase domain-containing protein n=1 Tax=Polypedilum vanderplanki TaxID=319348 RepID=A0A9J6BP60_POLVA|nr:hypothetical protein PVAND_001406 [Polypedilum vanderplanki]